MLPLSKQKGYTTKDKISMINMVGQRKISTKFKYSARFTVFFISVLVVMGGVAGFANGVTQGYKTVTVMPKGTVVSLTKDGSNQVEKTTTDNEKFLTGVVVDGSDSLIDIQPEGADVKVAVNGESSVLVSNQNGNIEKGDLLIVSPLAGIAMKDLPSSTTSKYVAAAGEQFNENSDFKEVEVKEGGGDTRRVRIGYIKTNLLLNDRADTAKDRNFLTSVAEKVVRRSVSTLQALLAAAIFVLGFIIVGSLLHSSIKGTFASLGRNPLARDSLLNGLVRVVFLAIVVLVATITSAYLILLI